MFNSRDPHNVGTVNMAQRPWATPFRRSGFHLSGHAGPAFTCINRSYGPFRLKARMAVRGTAQILWGYQGALGPNHPASDASLHQLVLTRYEALEITESAWKVLTVEAGGAQKILAEGSKPAGSCTIQIDRKDRRAQVWVAGKVVWQGETTDRQGPLGLFAGPNTHVEVAEFAIDGPSTPAMWSYLYTEGLLGAGEKESDWLAESGPQFRFGLGAVHHGPGGMAKWNFVGNAVRLWSPTGPSMGKVEVVLDGKSPKVVDLATPEARGSTVVWSAGGLPFGPHALVVRSLEGTMTLDGVEVVAAPAR